MDKERRRVDKKTEERKEREKRKEIKVKKARDKGVYLY